MPYMTTLSVWKLPVVSGALIVLIFGALLVTRKQGAFLHDAQQIAVTCVKWQPGSDDLKSLDILGHSISEKDVQRLRTLGLKGVVSLASSGTYGSGRRDASVLIVMRDPLKEATTLPQPDGTDLIYIQTEDGWKMYPSDAKTLQRKIRLTPDPRDPEFATLYMIEHADGSSQGGTLITWSK